MADEEYDEAIDQVKMETGSDDTDEDLGEDKLAKTDLKIKKDEIKIKKLDSKIKDVDSEIDSIEKKSASEGLSDVDETQALIDELSVEKPDPTPKQTQQEIQKAADIIKKQDAVEMKTKIYALRTTANREDQVMDFITSHAEKKGFKMYSCIRAHGMRGYVFVEAEGKSDAEQSAFNVPYARGILPKEINYHEIEHMLEQVKKDVNIQQNDIVEIISGPFKRENAKIIRLDKSKEEVVVELLEAAVPIPITLKLDSVKVIRRDSSDGPEEPSDV